MYKRQNGTSAALASPSTAASTSSNVYGVVSCEGSLNLRKSPSTDSEVLASLPSGYNLSVYDYADGWIKVSDDNGNIGYVKSDFISLKNGTKPSNKVSTPSTAASSTAAGLVAYAKQFLGNPYVYGGTSLTEGADCSGFTMKIFEHFGISTGRSSRDQAAKGKEIPIDSVQPGDLLFYASGDYINHVALYIGGGQIIHASTPKNGIMITTAYYRTPYKAVTFLN